MAPWIVSLATVGYYFFLSLLLLGFCFTLAFLWNNRNQPFLELDGGTDTDSVYRQQERMNVINQLWDWEGIFPCTSPHWHPWAFLCSSSEWKGYLKLPVTTSITER